jgi:hypothetical protein
MNEKTFTYIKKKINTNKKDVTFDKNIYTNENTSDIESNRSVDNDNDNSTEDYFNEFNELNQINKIDETNETNESDEINTEISNSNILRVRYQLFSENMLNYFLKNKIDLSFKKDNKNNNNDKNNNDKNNNDNDNKLPILVILQKLKDQSEILNNEERTSVLKNNYIYPLSPAGKLELGRLYGQKVCSIERIKKEYRNALIQPYYWDIDMSNACYTLITNIVDIDIPYCKKYVEKREQLIKKILKLELDGLKTREEVKNAFISTLYGSDEFISKVDIFEKIANERNIIFDKLMDISYFDPKNHNFKLFYKFLFRYYKDMNQIEPILENINIDDDNDDKEIKRVLIQLSDINHLKKIKRNKKLQGQFISTWAQTIERHILQIMDEELTKLGRSVDILEYDGLKVRRLKNETKFPSEIIHKLEDKIYEKMDIKIKLEVKPILFPDIFKEGYDFIEEVESKRDEIKKNIQNKLKKIEKYKPYEFNNIEKINEAMKIIKF